MNLGVKLLVVANLILLFIGLAGVIAGCAGDNWWVGGTEASYKEGLVNKCSGKTPCVKRSYILEFKEGSRGKLEKKVKLEK